MSTCRCMYAHLIVGTRALMCHKYFTILKYAENIFRYLIFRTMKYFNNEISGFTVFPGLWAFLATFAIKERVLTGLHLRFGKTPVKLSVFIVCIAVMVHINFLIIQSLFSHTERSHKYISVVNFPLYSITSIHCNISSNIATCWQKNDAC